MSARKAITWDMSKAGTKIYLARDAFQIYRMYETEAESRGQKKKKKKKTRKNN